MRGASTPALPVDDAGPLRPLLNGTIFAAIVYMIDAWVIGQGGLAIFVGMIAAVVAVVRALNAGVRKDRARAFAHLGVVVVWGATIALTFVSVRFQASHARVRAETVVVACKAYKAAHGTRRTTSKRIAGPRSTELRRSQRSPGAAKQLQ